ncbi:MAG: LLM class flavin-dependent oxidoreductase [Solirubrobacterales bacterium]
MSANSTGPRFGVWAIVHGGWATANHPDDPFDASWKRNKNLIVEAEELGFDATLVAQHTINPSGDDYAELEAWTASAALAALTERIEIIAAIKPYLYHPVVLAKQALQIDEISNGRFAINLVNAWYKPELDRAGIGFAEHDERYAYGREWLTIVRDLIAGRETSFDGRWFDVSDYRLNPGPVGGRPPTIYLGGESEPARALAADASDVWFINGRPIEEVRDLIADVGGRPRGGDPLRFALSAFVIARETEEEAAAAEAELWEIVKKDASDLERLLANADPKAEMFKTAARLPAIGTNGGTAAGLVGTYDQVAERIDAFHREGIELFMLQFQPFEPEMRRFAAEVLPRVRRSSALAA